MLTRIIATRFLFLGLALVTVFGPDVSAAGLGTMTRDGWHTWRVTAVDTSADWCCYDWNSGYATRKRCDLDDHRGGYGSADINASPPETMQIYALVESGKLTRVRALSAQCPVTSARPVNDLGPVTAADSVGWLRQHVSTRSGLNAQLLAAIAVHDGDEARDLLVGYAERHDELRVRKDALFWMGQVRSQETVSVIERIAYQDPDTEMRQHAIFVLAQLPNEAGIEALFAVVKNRASNHDDRKKALFWLAQSDSDRAFDFVAGLLDD